MNDAPLIVRENPTDYPAFSIVPFRCQMVATHPAENPVIRVESVEVWATCPDGWHESPISYATAMQPDPQGPPWPDSESSA